MTPATSATPAMLGPVLRDWRIMNRLTERETAARIGVSAATLCRVEACKPVDGRTLSRVLFWLLGGWGL